MSITMKILGYNVEVTDAVSHLRVNFLGGDGQHIDTCGHFKSEGEGPSKLNDIVELVYNYVSEV